MNEGIFRNDIKFLNDIRRLVNDIKIWWKYRSARKIISGKKKELEVVLKLYPDEARTSIEIVKLQAKKKSSDVLYAPVSGEFYIIHDEKYIILKAHSISIVNGLYKYYIDIPYEAVDHLDKFLKRIVERKRLKIKRQIESKITRSLNDILEHVKE